MSFRVFNPNMDYPFQYAVNRKSIFAQPKDNVMRENNKL